MPEITLSFHSDDIDIANTLSKQLKSLGNQVNMDDAPFTDKKTAQKWTELYPDTDALVVLYSANLQANVNKVLNENNAYQAKEKISQAEKTLPVITVVIDNIEPDPIFSDCFCLYGSRQKIEVLARNINTHVSYLHNELLSPYKRKMIWMSCIFLFMSALIYTMLYAEEMVKIQFIITPFYMMSLGALGAISYMLFNIVGLLDEKTFSVSNTDTNNLRIILGAITGWISYIILRNSNYYDDNNFVMIAIVAAFITGFSSKLVVGIINQAIDAIERATGITKSATKEAK
ncbi:MAG: hypothetical protein OEX03_03320 [Gammaproteobacteria bacterium]|nr:hypothetical protein [Gammaproteobacteria bacterium]